MLPAEQGADSKPDAGSQLPQDPGRAFPPACAAGPAGPYPPTLLLLPHQMALDPLCLRRGAFGPAGATGWALRGREGSGLGDQVKVGLEPGLRGRPCPPARQLKGKEARLTQDPLPLPAPDQGPQELGPSGR